MSWKDLSELAPALSEAELRFEKKRRLAGLVLGPSLFVLALVWPPFADVSDLGMRTLGIFLWAVVWWVTEPVPIPVTSFFVLALLVVSGVLGVDEAFAYWANWVNIFLIGAFIIAHAVAVHGLPRRLAFRMMASRLLEGSPLRLLVVMALGTALFSSVLSNVATTVIFVSIAIGLTDALDLSRESGFGEALFIAIAWGAGIGGIVTPVGSPPNAIVVGMLADQLDYRIGFLPWIGVFLPVAVLALVAMYLVMRYLIRPRMTGWAVSTRYAEEALAKLGPPSRGEKATAMALATALVLWMLPDLARLAFPGHPAANWLYARLDWSVSAILVATSLFLIPLDWKKRKFVLTWNEAIRGVDWGTLSLIASALALGNVIANPERGLGLFFEQSLSSLAASGGSAALLVAAFVTFTVVLTNLASNNAVVSMSAALALAVAPVAGVNPVALVATVAVASSMAFSLPISTPPNAIVFASGRVRSGTMAKGGTVLSVLSVIVLLAFGFQLADWMFPGPG